MLKVRHFYLPLLALVLGSNPVISQTSDTKTSTDYIQRGVELHSEEKYDEALAEFAKVHRNDSNYILAGLKTLNTLDAMKKYQEGLDLCENLLKEKTKFTPNYLVFKADFLDVMGRTEEAEKILAQGAKEYPLYYVLPYEKAMMALRKKKYQQSYELLIETIKINPFHASSHYQLGLFAYKNNNLTAALLAFQFYLLCSPESDRSTKLIPDLDKISKIELEHDSVTDHPFFKNQNDFTELESLLRSKVSQSKKFKSKSSLTYDLTKQTQLIVDNIGKYTDVSGFYNSFYGKFFAALNTSGYYEPFSYYTLSGMKIENVDKWLKKNVKVENEFELWVYYYFCKELAAFDENLNGKIEKVPHWYSNNLISAAGVRDAQNLNQGYWNFYYGNGIKRSEGDFVKGNKEGDWKFYYTDGVIKEKTTYKNGEEKVYTSYYSNGNPKVEIELVEGKLEGPKKVYYSNGNLAYTTDYKAGVEDGKEIHYYRNGVLRYSIDNKNGVIQGAITEYYNNGNLNQKLSFVNGLRDGAIKMYFNDTTNALLTEGQYIKGKKIGEWKSYFRSGKLFSVTHYNNEGELEGSYKQYYENGKVEEEEEYSNGKINGSDKLYNEDGTLWQEFTYKKGRLQEYRAFKPDGTKLCDNKLNGKNFKLVMYHPNGNIRREGAISDGLLEGAWKDYNLFGVLITEANYKEGNYDGEYRDFYVNGKVKRRRHYLAGDETGLYQAYYINGQLESEGQMKEGNEEGYWNYYFKNGTLKSTLYYLEGSKDGWATYYAVNGKMSSENLSKEYCIIKNLYYDTLGKISQNIDMPGGTGLVEKKGLKGEVLFKRRYKKDYVDGVSTTYYPNGKVENSVSYANGLRRGKSLYYNQMGVLENEVNYFNDEKAGAEKSYDSDGKLEYNYNYINGEYDGKCYTYYANGKVERDIMYDYGDAEGESNLYDEAGELMFQRRFHNDLLVNYSYKNASGQMVTPLVVQKGETKIVSYYQNGKKSMEASYLNGDLHGKRVLYHSNGKLKEESEYYYDNRQGTATTYFPDGTVKSKENHSYGSREGLQQYFHENGKLKCEVTYLNGTMHGWCKYYDKTGKLISSALYYNGDAIVLN